VLSGVPVEGAPTTGVAVTADVEADGEVDELTPQGGGPMAEHRSGSRNPRP
jgi:hypothetical protein